MTKQLIDFAELRRLARFEPVLAHYGLKPLGRGAQKTILCPFHAEKDPSCKVNLEKKAFHCFGCQAKGNILDFVARKEDSSLTDAAEKLAEICGISLADVAKATTVADPGRKPERGRRKAQDARDDPPIGKTTSPAEKPNREAPVASERPINTPLSFSLTLDPSHEYLREERALDEATIAHFGLGSSSRGMMKGRICIPIHNEAGELVAYAGRWPENDGFPEGEGKYKLPPGFEKSRILFNLHRVPEGDHVIVVEGFFSVIRLYKLGIENIVALMGTCLLYTSDAADE